MGRPVQSPTLGHGSNVKGGGKWSVFEETLSRAGLVRSIPLAAVF